MARKEKKAPINIGGFLGKKFFQKKVFCFSPGAQGFFFLKLGTQIQNTFLGQRE